MIYDSSEDQQLIELRKKELLERKLNETPTWGEIFNLLSEIQGRNVVNTNYIHELLIQESNPKTSDEREKTSNDLGVKIALSISHSVDVCHKNFMAKFSQSISE